MEKDLESNDLKNVDKNQKNFMDAEINDEE